MGVGSAGIAGNLEFSLAYCELIGVFGDTSSSVSIFDTDRFLLFRFFRLEDEKFFLNPGREWVRVGEPERGISLFTLSWAKFCSGVGVGGDTISFGLGAGKGDEAFRVGTGIGGSASRFCRVDISPAVFGCTDALSGIRGGGIDGC